MFSLRVDGTAVQTHLALFKRITELAPIPPPKYLKSLNFLVYKIRY